MKPEGNCASAEMAVRVPNLDRILWEHDRSSVDEFVVHNATVHLEQMSDDCYWLGIERGGRMLMVNIYREKKRDPLRCHVKTDGGEWPWDRDEEHEA